MLQIEYTIDLLLSDVSWQSSAPRHFWVGVHMTK